MRVSRRACFRMDGPGGRRPAGGPGFTLAEILVAVGVLMVAFLGVITVYLVGYGDISEGGRDTLAAVVAQTLVENIRNQPLDDLAQLNGMDTGNTAFCAGATLKPRIGALCVAWTAQVSQLPGGQGVVTVVPNLNATTGIQFQTITIILAWTEANRGARTLTVITARSN